MQIWICSSFKLSTLVLRFSFKNESRFKTRMLIGFMLHVNVQDCRLRLLDNTDVTSGGEARGPPGPLILGKKQKNHRRKESRRGKHPPLPTPPHLSSRSGAATENGVIFLANFVLLTYLNLLSIPNPQGTKCFEILWSFKKTSVWEKQKVSLAICFDVISRELWSSLALVLESSPALLI